MHLVKNKENKIVKLKKKLTTAHERRTFGHHILQTDKKIKFYSGIPTRKAFDEIYQMLLPKLKKMKHWHGPSKVSSPLKKQPESQQVLGDVLVSWITKMNFC